MILTFFYYHYFRKLIFGVIKIIFQGLWNSVCGGDGRSGGYFIDDVMGAQVGWRGIKGGMKPAGHRDLSFLFCVLSTKRGVSNFDTF